MRAVGHQGAAAVNPLAASSEPLAGPMPVPVPLLPDDLMREVLATPRRSAPRLPQPPAANLRSARKDLWVPAEVGAHQDFIDLVRGTRREPQESVDEHNHSDSGSGSRVGLARSPGDTDAAVRSDG